MEPSASLGGFRLNFFAKDVEKTEVFWPKHKRTSYFLGEKGRLMLFPPTKKFERLSSRRILSRTDGKQKGFEKRGYLKKAVRLSAFGIVFLHEFGSTLDGRDPSCTCW